MPYSGIQVSNETARRLAALYKLPGEYLSHNTLKVVANSIRRYRYMMRKGQFYRQNVHGNSVHKSTLIW
jgi:hypothetical protein